MATMGRPLPVVVYESWPARRSTVRGVGFNGVSGHMILDTEPFQRKAKMISATERQNEYQGRDR